MADFFHFKGDSESAAIAHSLSIVQTQNADLQAELAQCRQELAQIKAASTVKAIDQQRYEAEHLQIAATLDQSEIWLRLAIDLNQVSLWAWDRATGKTEWNAANYQLLGYEPGEVEPSYERWLDRLHPDDRERVETTPAQAIQTRSVRQIDYRVIHPDGSIHWLVDRTRWRYDSAGQPVQMLGVSMDVTESKAIEEAYHDLNAELARHVQAQTQQLQASEASLRQQEQEFRTLAENSPDAIFRFDLAFCYLYLNPAAERTLGLPRSRVLGKSDRELNLPTETVALWEKTLQMVVQHRELVTVEFFTPNYNNGQWFQSHNIPEFDPDGNLVSILVIERDITTLKQTEAALRQSEEQFRAFFENSPMAIGLATLDDHYMVRSNAKYQEMLGYSDLELCQMTFMDLTHPDDITADLTLFDQLLAGSISRFHLEKRYRCKNGDFIWVDLTVALVYDTQGEPLYSLCMPQDITKAKRLDAERRQTEEALRRSQASLSEAQRVAHVGSWEVDLITQQGVWSAELFRLFGLDPNRPKPTIAEILQLIHPSDRALYSQVIQRAFEQGEPHAVDHRIVRPDGSIAWISSLGQVECNAAGQVTRLFGVALDITDRKQAEETLRQQADREQLLRIQQAALYQQVQTELGDRKRAEASLRKSLQEKEVLLKEVHHRVKNNLQIVSSLLRMQSRKVENLQTFTILQEAQNRVQSMALIHEQLYQSSNLAEIDLNEYLHSLVNNLLRSYGIHSHQVTFSIETHNTYLDLNTAISCGLIINELVSNSLKYAFPNEQFGEIKICLTSVFKQPLNLCQVTLLVSDSGVGIPIAVDWQNSPSLGMRIVRNLVHQLKGNITLLPGSGTAFQVTFAIANEA